MEAWQFTNSHLIPVKSFSFGVSNSKSLETNVNLSIRPKTIISSMLVLILVFNEKNICKLSLPLLSPHTMNTVMHSYDISAVLSRFFSAKDRQKPGQRFQVCKIFVPSSCATFLFQTSGWRECFMQVRKHYIISDNVQIPLNFLLRVSFNNLKFFNQNIPKRIFLINEEMWSSINNLHSACVCSLLQALHTWSGHVYSFYAHCTHLCTMGPLACNKL